MYPNWQNGMVPYGQGNISGERFFQGPAALYQWHELALGEPRTCPQDSRLQVRFCPIVGQDIYCDTNGYPHQDLHTASQCQNWLERRGDGEWTWFTVGDTVNVGLDFLKHNPNLQCLWSAYGDLIRNQPTLTNAQRMQWAEQECIRRGIPCYDEDYSPLFFNIVLTEQIMRERRNPPGTQVVVAPQAGAQSSNSTNTTTTNNTQNVQNNQHNYNIQINQAPRQAPAPLKIPSITGKMRVAAANYFLEKAKARGEEGGPKASRTYDKLIEGRLDEMVQRLLNDKATLPTPEPQKALPPPEQQRQQQPVVQYAPSQPVQLPPQQVQQQQVVTTTTTTSQSASSWSTGSPPGGAPFGSPVTFSPQQQQQPGIEMAMAMANVLAGEGRDEEERSRDRRHKSRSRKRKEDRDERGERGVESEVRSKSGETKDERKERKRREKENRERS